ncbi:class I SAM-dependent methyltransferase [Ancylobacter aquaticus]|nr:class I SAM-dependent methyltransferase [Ancylobacter aquaticus]
MDHRHAPFINPSVVASYAADAPRKVPGLADVHRMVMLLLAEGAPGDAHILVVGAGGGMETRAMAEAQPAWRFTGVDPSPAMLDLARQTVAPSADRVDLIQGIIDQAPEGPFDGATCLLTLHHLDRNERLRTLKEIRRRLGSGARLVTAAHSAPGPDPERWMARSVAFGDRGGPDRAKGAAIGRMMMERLPLLTPAQEEGMLREAGFTDVELFYAALSFRGWVGIAS